MEDMDNRLDFFNYLKSYLDTLDEENDSIMVVTYNKEEGDMFTSLFGNWETLSASLSNEDARFMSEEMREKVNPVKQAICNISLNIIAADDNRLLKTRDFLDELIKEKGLNE